MKELKFITETDWEKWRVSTIYTKEPETIAWIKDFEGDCTFWDIGANIGIYSIFCAVVHPQSRIYAFEPLRTNFIRLWDNIWTNNLTNVEAHYKCLGSFSGTCVFDAARTEVGSSGGGAREIIKAHDTGNNAYFMPITTGDEFWSVVERAAAPNHIKIDVDGTELDILEGMPGVLSCAPLKSILVEINQRENEVYGYLERMGFEPDAKYNDLKDRELDHNVIFRRV